jgi:hypothetical protein
MTIHFRSRIQTPLDYTEYLFPGVQGCCCTGSSPDTAFPSSYGNCNALDGYFTISETCDFTCFPKGTTGCCCACAYDGATNGIEYSVCQDLDGVWTPGLCDVEAPSCINFQGRDVRNKRACCGFTYDSTGTVISDCFDVCTEKDCYALKLGNFAPTFFPTGGNCTVLIDACASSPQGLAMNNDRTEILGNCCVQGAPCKCYKNITPTACDLVNGSFYLLGDPEFSCTDCINNCSETV